MQFDPDTLKTRDIYHHMVRLITPRPIAWVSTISATGILNLAPFSFFCGVGANPPLLAFCPANLRDGSPKDTLRNIEQTGEFVVNIVPHRLAEQMNDTSAAIDADRSEFDVFDVEAVASARVAPPRVARSPAQLECQLHQVIKLGTGPSGANLVLGRIVMMHVDDGVLDSQGFADPAELDTIGRLGGSSYTRTTNRFDMPPPG